jgi:hypothetical protein
MFSVNKYSYTSQLQIHDMSVTVCNVYFDENTYGFSGEKYNN